MIRLGMLTCGAFDDETIGSKYEGDYVDFFYRGFTAAGREFSYKNYHVFEDEFPDTIEECNAWLVTGSKNGAYEDLPWIHRLQSFVKKSYDAQIPLVGICFGHQLLAQALGGKVEKAKAGWGIGVQKYTLFEPLGGIEGNCLKLYAIHQDQVVKLPPQGRVIASTDHCPIAAIRYQGPAVSFQPHPEFTKEFEHDLVKRNIGVNFSEKHGQQALDSLETESVQNREVMAYIADFITDYI
ncbi:type 1 glutamine amidotransferase [Terasakiella sp. SH-1]|uniref:type 1 glutamine amidotransferase n=1 Tax=Terasakiella sp. SH-1 TaxID=2560057 RepID=UPI0010743F25|nr:type 1 glutamine amidotransferase [Terasakiella sp. SH-1]